MSRVSFSGIPAVIDPASPVLELRQVSETGGSRLTHLYRVQLQAYDYFPVVQLGAANLYGDAEELMDCQLVFGYDLAGLLLVAYSRDAEGDWSVTPLPPEVTGHCSRVPSIRFFLKDMESARLALRFWKELKRCQGLPKSLPERQHREQWACTLLMEILCASDERPVAVPVMRETPED